MCLSFSKKVLSFIDTKNKERFKYCNMERIMDVFGTPLPSPDHPRPELDTGVLQPAGADDRGYTLNQKINCE